jgi:alpha-1,4-galacturonosyltransferase
MVRRRRRSVLLLLLALTVLSPLVLYTRRLSAALNPNQRRDLPGEIVNQGRGVKASKLNALPLVNFVIALRFFIFCLFFLGEGDE